MWRILILSVALATPAAAERKIGAEDFDAMTRGRTVVYMFNGMFHGMERHLGDRRVEWAYDDGQCFTGRWYEAGENICFVYENLDGQQCWRFEEDPGGFIATFVDDMGDGTTFSAEITDEAMPCTGPLVGA